MKYGMVIDLSRCVGCDACFVACKQANGTGPGVSWNKVARKEVGVYPSARMEYLPVLCNHCENPPCADVCPIGATQIQPNGAVMVDSELCVGCRYCMVACPYDVRSMVETTKKSYYEEKGLTPYETAMYSKHKAGTVEKCTFCEERLAEGKIPACAQACPANARTFGDLDDPASEISQLLAQKEHRVLQSEAGTKPKVFYI